MGKRPRTPHFITGIGDGNVNLADSHKSRVPNDDIFLPGGNAHNKNSGTGSTNAMPGRYIRTRNERWMRLEEPLLASDHWRDAFGSGDPAIGKTSTMTTGPWQVSAFAILGMIVVVSAIFLHMVSESSSESSTPYHYRRRYRQRRMYRTRKKKTDEWSDDEEEMMQKGMYRTRKKKTDEWSDDEEEILQNGIAIPGSSAASMSPGEGEPQVYPYYYHQPPVMSANVSSQEHRLRRTSNKDPYTPPTASGGRTINDYYLPPQPVVPAYKSPSANMMNMAPGGAYRRGVSPGNSYSSGQGPSPSRVMRGIVPLGPASSGMGAQAPLSGRLRVPTPPDARDLFPPITGQNSSGSGGLGRLPAPPEGSELLLQPMLPSATNELNARPLNSSNFSSFESMEASQPTSANSKKSNTPSSVDSLKLGEVFGPTTHHGNHSNNPPRLHGSFSSSMVSSRHQLMLSPGNCDETPLIGNQRIIAISGTRGLDAARMPSLGGEEGGGRHFPFIPTLETSTHNLQEHPPRLRAATPPPRSVLMDELRLVQMETGNSMHWGVQEDVTELQDPSESHNSFYEDYGEPFVHGAGTIFDSDSEVGDSDISIPSGDPRKSIIHKRSNLTMATDAASSLQSGIDFEELKLQEVIGGGGFGQVWKATWRGTPVAVKVLTGSAQNKHIAKSILEEFKAEINLLKGMRHPNICLYMGACLDPPNRAIITELAANGSVWDALRLPLMPPFVPADGTQRGAWPLQLYIPDPHGTPPSDNRSPRLSAPIPPKGTWPWQLVKRVACGAARGMAYLHSGIPPVLHRDLKSANLLLDESYTAKVCDFGLSRVKAQERSMTGNCGTVQWMAPEVLANQRYNEKADIYSFGIILWELLSRECPYDGMTAIQCALGVLNRDKRPEIPKWCPPSLHALIKSCVKKDPDQRPSFAQILLALDAIVD